MLVENNIFNPFPGLRSFEENEDVLFFGREKQVDELVKKLRLVKFLAVIGSSGSGKSSLVKSGLIPALHSGFMAGAGSNWKICTFRPGIDPIGNMAKALASNNVLYNNLSEEETYTYGSIHESTLRRSSQGLVEVYKQSGINSKHNVLILVDQFEELFRFSKLEKDAKEGKRDSIAFINLLLKASEQKEFPIYVVFTMRSDFLGDCTEFRGLPEAINQGQYLVPRMTREERREAIAGPISVGGATITPRLLNQLLNDVGDNPDQLPILQHALMRTWDVWKAKNNHDAAIDIEEYEETGTMAQALSQHAEEAYNELETEHKKEICESLFKALTDRGSDARGIRRPTKLSEICKLANAKPAEVIEVIEVFRQPGRSFLMPPANIAITEDTVIDISHESLMRCWTRLINWVEEENQSADVYLRLCEAANLYELGKGGLWRDPELQVAWKWKEEANPNVTWASRYNNYFDKAMLFLSHCKQQNELELQHKEQMQKRRLRRARIIAIFISCIALLAFVLAIYSFDQRNQANKQKNIAQNKTVEAEKERKNALAQKSIAEQNAEEAKKQAGIAKENEAEANKQRNNAVASAKAAEEQRKKAEANAEEAQRQEAEAKKQTGIAKTEKEKAESNEQKAKEQTAIAKSEKEKADKERNISNRLKSLAEARNLANQSLLKFREGNKTESKKLALQAYELNKENDGPKQNSEVYAALHTNWTNSINKANQATYHNFPVKCLVGKPNSNIVFTADESGLLYTTKAENGTISPIGKPTNLKEDIRVLTTSADGSKLFVATANGTGYVFDISNTTSIKQVLKFGFTGIAKSVAVVDNNHFIVLTNKEIKHFTTDATSIMQGSIPKNNLAALCLGKSGKLYLAGESKIWIYDTYDDLIKNNASKTYQLPSTVMSLTIDATESYLAAGTYNGVIWVRDIHANNETTLPLHKSSVNDVRLTKLNNGSVQLASAGADQAIKLIDVKQVLSGRSTEDIITLNEGGHTKWVYAVWYSNDGEHLYSCSEDKKIIGWKKSMDALYKALK
jgi:WD40 repeat protein/energy-coupling factor transporter ATP-binding protein EcfA2